LLALQPMDDAEIILRRNEQSKANVGRVVPQGAIDSSRTMQIGLSGG